MPLPLPLRGRCGGPAFAFSLTVALALSACGASYQSVYENEVHFEHCYAVDVSPNMPQSSKLQCWTEWSQRFSQGQARDRVEYAYSRQRALLSGADDPAPRMTIGAQPSNAPPPLAASPVVASPLPRTPYEGPPATMAFAPASASASAAPAPPAKAEKNLSPTQLCTRDCGEAFTSCTTACQRNACYNRCGDLAKKCISDCL
ncbi:MAG: hypothetical protein MUF34_24740 [Polyangiaceae bacterium]|nr:hypothetical protein [Polyangiaceae bacterium]